MKNTIEIDNRKEKILIIGANGFLGSTLLHLPNKEKINPQKYFFIAADRTNSNIPKLIPFYQIDIINYKKTIKKIIEISPEIIILTAAMTDVDECEKNKKISTKINYDGTKNVVKACEKIDSKLLFLSTDFVFDGTKTEGYYTENDIPNPINHYGKTKYQAEQAIVNSNVDYLICRTAVLYGWNQDKLNFITWVLTNLESNNKISIITTQINNPTFVVNLAEIIIKLIEKNAKGIYHTAGNQSLSRYETALKCAKIFDFDKNLILPVKTLNQIAPRPINVGLNITKLEKLLNNELRIFNLLDGLNYMRNNKDLSN